MIVLFSSGEYSDYGLSGLLEVDESAYHKAKAEYDQLGEQQKQLKQERFKLINSGKMTKSQSARTFDEIQQVSEQRRKVWEALRATGTPVEYTEFWQGEAY